jgi:plasmid stabilization system protein ParE
MPRLKLLINYNDDFLKNFKIIWDYIANDNINTANRFKAKLKRKIENLFDMPFKFRKLYYYDSKDIRDLVFKGYTVPYIIDKKKNKIIILDMFKWINK